MASEAENIVNEFCRAISRKNLDELLTYFFWMNYSPISLTTPSFTP